MGSEGQPEGSEDQLEGSYGFSGNARAIYGQYRRSGGWPEGSEHQLEGSKHQLEGSLITKASFSVIFALIDLIWSDYPCLFIKDAKKSRKSGKKR